MSFDGANTPPAGALTISVRNAGKAYHMYESPAHRLWQSLFGRRKTFFRNFWALRGIDMDVMRGETMGIIGRNGSGKSTLLQMIAGTLTPTEGSVSIHGRVAALLELGSGFNPEFTGRENVYLNAAIYGLTREETARRLDDILAFADIGEFIDQPVRSYSSGMALRLAFAVIVHVDADVLIIDEALSVGDAFFSQKCMRFLREFKKRGTLLFVSHDAGAVTGLCDRAIWLENGAMRGSGSAREVVEAYMAELHVVERRRVAGERVVASRPAIAPDAVDHDVRDVRAQADAPVPAVRTFAFDPERSGLEFGAGKAQIVSVRLLQASGDPVLFAEGGEIVDLVITAKLGEPLDGLIFGFYVKDRLGQRLFGDNSYLVYQDAPVAGAAGDMVSARFRFRMPHMPSGSYMIDAAVASGTQYDHTQQHWIHDALEFRALDETMRFGLVGIPMLDIQVRQDSME
ncbi:ABC transporter ATP-binding protein [Lysobacter helvus]|uniref:ABC transporter ATP-binding protein n=2 Tax=Lysobacteraceae TaxID=32033 RepID=A0ABM7Q3L8_9GAMM|nr:MULTISPECIES: ABC transporter ATP-binding protein [Lysobacter]BCT91858.1 ABC transporter ATP-binding protein [Lysobacter caseinilyticus]BCT95011.1 ABC transporter ATP-binding protein [Lysobacter helvus]